MEGQHDHAQGADEVLTRRVGAFTKLPSLIRQVGGDPDAIFADAGLGAGALDSPSNRIAYDVLLRILNDTATLTGCEHFGLLVGQAWHLADLGLLGEIMRHSPRVDRALQELVLHQHINSEGTLAFMVQRGVVVDLGYASYAYFGARTAHLYDAVMAFAANFMREICGPGWSASMVFLPHSAPADIEPYHRCFHAPVHFDAEMCALRFHASWLERSIEGADPERLRAAEAQARAAGQPPLMDLAHRALRTLLIHGRASGADVAQSLAMHRRTLHRHLREAGTSFQPLLDRVRLAVAKELLQDSRATMLEVAAALGYRDTAAFFKAFRRWSGTTPGEWRQASLSTRAPGAAPDPAGAPGRS